MCVVQRRQRRDASSLFLFIYILERRPKIRSDFTMRKCSFAGRSEIRGQCVGKSGLRQPSRHGRNHVCILRRYPEPQQSTSRGKQQCIRELRGTPTISAIATHCLGTEHNTVEPLQTLLNKENAKMQMAILAITVSPRQFRTIMASTVSIRAAQRQSRGPRGNSNAGRDRRRRWLNRRDKGQPRETKQRPARRGSIRA